MIEENGQGKELKEQGLGEAGEQRMRGKRQLCCEGQGKDRAEAQLKAGTEEKVGMGAQQQEAGGGECRQHVVGAAQRAGQELEEQHNDGAQCGAGAAREDAVAQDQKRADEGRRIVAEPQPPEQTIKSHAENREMEAGNGQNVRDAVFLIQGEKLCVQIGLIAQQKCLEHAGILRGRQTEEDTLHPAADVLQQHLVGNGLPAGDFQAFPVHGAAEAETGGIEGIVEAAFVPGRRQGRHFSVDGHRLTGIDGAGRRQIDEDIAHRLIVAASQGCRCIRRQSL